MFDQLKQLKAIKDMQDALAKEVVTVEKEGVKIVMNGKMEIKELRLNPDHDVAKQEELVKKCFEDALKQVQTAAAKKLFSQT